MDTLDLMIGDWVMDGDVAARVTSLTCDGIIETTHRVSNVEVVEPIPLTPEILHKNGFHFGNTTDEEEFSINVGCGLPEPGWCYDEGGGEIKIIFPNGTDGGLIRIDDGCSDRCMEFVFVNPIMVHELQHVLRLCGIDKEIML